MSFFDDIETPIEKLPTGFGLPLGTYPVVCTQAKVFTKKQNGQQSLVLKFRVTDGDLVGQTEDWWIQKPDRKYAVDKQGNFNKEALIMTAKNAKRAFEQLGLSTDEMEAVDFDNVDSLDVFVGKEGTLKLFQTKNQVGTNYNTKEFKLSDEESGASDLSADPVESESGDFDFNSFLKQ